MITGLTVPFLTIAIVSCAKREVLTISAAISLRAPLLDIANQFHLTYPHTQLVFNFGSSGSLRHQIENGAPVDIYMSAASNDMETLLNKGLVERDSHQSILANSIVLITHNTNSTINDFTDLSGQSIDKIAVGHFNSVPVGRYAKDTLRSMELLEILRPKLVFAKNALQIITYVESKNIEAGFVYKTDALKSKNIKIIAAVDPSTHRPINYYYAIIQNSPHSELANTFLHFVKEDSSMKLFQDHGFLTEEALTSQLTE